MAKFYILARGRSPFRFWEEAISIRMEVSLAQLDEQPTHHRKDTGSLFRVGTLFLALF